MKGSTFSSRWAGAAPLAATGTATHSWGRCGAGQGGERAQQRRGGD